jgi:CRISPR/Cas system CMR subunit Cmr4 (Cas7 group RAMP superfamily)
MNTRYKITRLDKQGNPTLSLEECQNFFATQSDFEYHDSFGASQDGVHMKIKGHFFMWQLENVQVPFRFYEGEIYVAITHPVVLDKAMEIARLLEANYIEG